MQEDEIKEHLKLILQEIENSKMKLMSKSLTVLYVVIPSVKVWLFLLLLFVVIMMPLLSMQSFVVTVLAFIIEKCFFYQSVFCNI